MREMKKKSLIVKFMGLFLILVLVILGTFFLLIFFVRNIALTQAEYKLEKEHDQIAQNVNLYLDTLENIAFMVSYSTPAQSYVQESDMLERILKQKEMQTLYVSMTTMLREIKGFYLYDEPFKGILRYGQCIESYQAEAYGIRPGEEVQYSGGYTTSIGLSVFSVIYPIYRMKETRLLGEIMGYTGITVDTSGLGRLIQEAGIYPESRVYLNDRTGKLLCSNLGDQSGEKRTDSGYGTEEDISIRTVIERTGWELLSIMPKGVVAQEFQPIIPLMYAAGSVVILLIILTIVLIYCQVFRPVRGLSDFMEQVPENAGPIWYEVKRRDEIGVMAEAMNYMLDSLSKRNEELRVSETERLKAELARQQMEILAYRNQINPHFLYNTLECIRGIAFYHDAPEIVEISQALSRMLRYAVKGGGFVLVREELRYIREYAKIIDYRFNHKITLRYEIAEELDELQILKLCLQPLVENAVSHGLETKRSKGEIVITGNRPDDRLILRVKDNGAGMEEDVLCGLREAIKTAYSEGGDLPAAEQHLGIFNIARRMYLNYGAAGGMRIESTPEEGTCVILEIPVEMGDLGVSDFAGG